jgi:hypothetical protein
MRILSSLTAILVAGGLLPCVLVAQNPAYVSQVSVHDSGAAVEVEIHTTGTIASPNTQAITGPDRIVVDFPGALPASALRALKVNHGPLKGVRCGLFFSNPPITRVVLDLTSAQSYQIAEIPHGFVLKLAAGNSPSDDAETADNSTSPAPRIAGARLTAVARVSETQIYSAPQEHHAIQPAPRPVPQIATQSPMPQPPKPAVNVSFQDGMLRIQAEKATLAQVLFEVQRQTQAEIGIPAGAEQEQVAADLGPAPARDVLASLLNGSSYNFIFVGNEQDGSLGKVILSRRDPGF